MCVLCVFAIAAQNGIYLNFFFNFFFINVCSFLTSLWLARRFLFKFSWKNAKEILVFFFFLVECWFVLKILLLHFHYNSFNSTIHYFSFLLQPFTLLIFFYFFFRIKCNNSFHFSFIYKRRNFSYREICFGKKGKEKETIKKKIVQTPSVLTWMVIMRDYILKIYC